MVFIKSSFYRCRWTDFDSVNWDMFTLVDTASPYTINKLAFTTLTVWRTNYAKSEEASARTF